MVHDLRDCSSCTLLLLQHVRCRRSSCAGAYESSRHVHPVNQAHVKDAFILVCFRKTSLAISWCRCRWQTERCRVNLFVITKELDPCCTLDVACKDEVGSALVALRLQSVFPTSSLNLLCSVDPMTLKEWYDIKAPSIFQVRAPGKTLVTRTKGTSESLRDYLLVFWAAFLSKVAA